MSFEPRRNLQPRVATQSKWARIEALLRNRAFAAEYAAARVLCGPADRWFGDHGPRSGSITPEDVGPWGVGYWIVRGRQ